MIAFGNLKWQLFAGTRDELKIEIQREDHQTSQMVILNFKSKISAFKSFFFPKLAPLLLIVLIGL